MNNSFTKEGIRIVDSRLPIIFEEACKLFIDKGFARTQIGYIAKASSVSVGAVYTLFTSKTAIFNFVLKCIIDPDYLNNELSLPIKDEDFSGLYNKIMILFEESNLNFVRGIESDSYGFENMLSDCFDIISKYGAGFLIIQRNGDDFSDLFKEYTHFRKEFCNHVEKYVNKFMQKGSIRKLDHPEHHARLIIETLSWWGMHVRYDAFETNTTLSGAMAKEVAIDALMHAYVNA